MQYAFTKMHGLGNDFVVFDAFTQPLRLTPEQFRLIGDRHFGIGCDQILLVEPPTLPDTDFNYRIFNADGDEVEQCGNGARCFARYVRDKGLTEKQEITVGTKAGIIKLFVEADGMVRVNMGAPLLEPGRIPFVADRQAADYPVEVLGETITLGAVSMGNPHAVIVVDDLENAPLERIGSALQQHPRFPQRVNVGFMQILSADAIALRVFERGVGETLACGTGACAAVVSGRLRGLLNKSVKVSLPGGALMIEWLDEQAPVLMYGPAASVFEGNIDL
ncbi:diaminopimelate epimerase [Sedimenticola sp.]|uniref:diaminopimelate epimerase n=1 Tax=Sedimenticola sp. TaxID=1940285 RepID=UPI00258A07EC|nr:diaminopimelate epimerase [Sedimenticola sp.]MCW8903681.1 diaminopimelate epimerase [Sedimenticola sp.]